MRARRLIFVLVAIIVVAAVIAALVVGFGYSKVDNEPKLKMLTVEELELPEVLLKNDLIGLFFYDDDGAYKLVTEDGLGIDPEKPILTYAHGMGDGSGHKDRVKFPNAKELSKYYNLFVFRWAPFADDMNVIKLSGNEWGANVNGVEYVYPDESGNRVKEKSNLYNHCVAEIYATYYCHLVTNYELDSNEIIFSGHSMGGQLTAAVASYLLTYAEGGGLEWKYMPSRFVMLDPFLSSVKDNVNTVDWLGDRIFGEYGNAGLVAETAIRMKEYGIALEYVLTGIAHALASQYFDKILENVAIVHVAADFLPGTAVTEFTPWHYYAVEWFYWSNVLLYDKATENSSYAITLKMPWQYAMSLSGVNQVMEPDYTDRYYEDDVISSKNKKATVCGYAFDDANGNGEFDEKFNFRREGVKVSLYADGVMVAETTTNKGGYYCFDVASKYINSNLKITVAGREISLKGTSDTGNKINTNGESSAFKLAHPKQTVLVNIGIKVSL